MNEDFMYTGVFLFMSFFVGGITGFQVGFLVAMEIMTNKRK